MRMKHFVKQPGEFIVGVTCTALTDLQSDSKCDCCGKDLARGARVVGKNVKVESFGASAGRFSPTCLQCSGMN